MTESMAQANKTNALREQQEAERRKVEMENFESNVEAQKQMRKQVGLDRARERIPD